MQSIELHVPSEPGKETAAFLLGLVSRGLLWLSALMLCGLWSMDMPETNWINFIALLLLIEFMMSAVSWLKNGDWQYLLSFGYIILIINGGSFYAFNYRETIDTADANFFLGLCEAGYLAMRAGVVLSSRTRFFNRTVLGLEALLTPFSEDNAGNYLSCLIVTFFLSFGLFSFFVYFHNFPLLTEDPSYTRYLYFNGPYTSGITRSFYRLFLSGTEVAVMMLIYYIAKLGKDRPKPFSYYFAGITVIVFAIAMLAINASRGPLFDVFVFGTALGITRNFSFRKLIKISAAVLLIFGLLLFITLQREGIGLDNLDTWEIEDSLYNFVPEVAEGSMVVGVFRASSEPLLYGRTFVSGLLTFLPSSLSSFREKYEINRYCLDLIDYSESESAGGIRSTYFGEAYINFGVLGTVAMSLALGFLLGKAELFQKDYEARKTFGFYFLFIFLAVLPVFSSGYFILIYIAVGLAVVMRKFSGLFYPQRKAAPA